MLSYFLGEGNMPITITKSYESLLVAFLQLVAATEIAKKEIVSSFCLLSTMYILTFQTISGVVNCILIG